MSSSIRTLKPPNPWLFQPGDTTVFTTRVVGQGPTWLYIVADGFTQVGWHKELCCQDTIIESVLGSLRVDIGAAGALVTVGNYGPLTVKVYTDYI